MKYLYRYVKHTLPVKLPHGGDMEAFYSVHKVVYGDGEVVIGIDAHPAVIFGLTKEAAEAEANAMNFDLTYNAEPVDYDPNLAVEDMSGIPHG